MLLTENYRANERRANDVYETPPALIEAALDLIQTEPDFILDVHAGDGRWGQAAQERWPMAWLDGVEMRDLPRPEGFDMWICPEPFPGPNIGLEPNCDLIIGNPAYKNAEETIRAALDLLSPTGTLLFLLPLRFLASQSRRDGLFREFPPREVHVCSKRPSFSGDGKTNAVDFAIYLWHKPFRGVPALKWLKEKR